MRASRDLAKKQEPRPRHVPCGSRRAACGMRAPAGAKKVRSWEFSSSAKSYAYNVVEYDKFFGVDEVDVKHGDRSGHTLCVSADFLLFKSLSEVQQTDDRTVQYSPDAQAVSHGSRNNGARGEMHFTAFGTQIPLARFALYLKLEGRRRKVPPGGHRIPCHRASNTLNGASHCPKANAQMPFRVLQLYQLIHPPNFRSPGWPHARALRGVVDEQGRQPRL